MNAPAPSWSTVPVKGTWKKLDGTPHSGTIKFTVSTRIVSNTDDMIFPAGGTFEAQLGTETGSINILLPAVDDPDNSPSDWSIKVEEKLSAGGGSTYYIQPRLSHLPNGLNLRSVVVPGPGTPPASLVRGKPGGVAALDNDGDVLNAAGQKVAGGGGVSSWNDLTDKPTTFPPAIGPGATQAAAGNDPRLSDSRTPSPHTHSFADTPGLTEAISGKAAVGHSHGFSDVPGLQGALDAKAATSHTHTKSQVGLGNVDNTADADKPVSTATATALAGKAATAHTHTLAAISDFAAEIAKTDAVIRYATVQPLRTTVTSDVNRRVRWVTPSTPAIGNGYAIDGVDIWEKVL